MFPINRDRENIENALMEIAGALSLEEALRLLSLSVGLIELFNYSEEARLEYLFGATASFMSAFLEHDTLRYNFGMSSACYFVLLSQILHITDHQHELHHLETTRNVFFSGLQFGRAYGNFLESIYLHVQQDVEEVEEEPAEPAPVRALRLN